MKAIDRRLRKLQDRFAPEASEEDFRLVTLLRNDVVAVWKRAGAL